jgi:hypothetical protein
MKLNQVLDTLINKFHIILGTSAQAALIFYHFKTGKDLGPGLVNSVYAYYAFLAGHAVAYQKWPDKDESRDLDQK